VQFCAPDDLQDPTAGARSGQRGAGSLISSIGKDLHNERPQRPGSFIEHKRNTVTILNIGGVDRDAQQQTERINEDVPLAPGDLLARIIALRVKRGPPFCAALALWLSMMAAVGLASRPSCSRTAT
jgi:hypothetical protein